MTDWKSLVGKRVLIRPFLCTQVFEAKVIEVSPSGKFVKLRYCSGEEQWKDAELIDVEEVLE